MVKVTVVGQSVFELYKFVNSSMNVAICNALKWIDFSVLGRQTIMPLFAKVWYRLGCQDDNDGCEASLAREVQHADDRNLES